MIYKYKESDMEAVWEYNRDGTRRLKGFRAKRYIEAGEAVRIKL